MDEFRIKHCEAEHGSGSFPKYRELSDEEAEAVARSLKQRLLIELDPALYADQVDWLRSCRHANGQDASRDDFDLDACMNELGLSMTDHCFWIYLGTPDRFFELQSREVSVHFDDLFYPGPDDVIICPTDVHWAIHVHHEGDIYYATV
ncbi:hypothetical protein [Mucisphaera sp.]|uniref:hypothetical protein n=1 Tax=Mucisphaera sp. TaxID=2913024 RepID=UPI003D0C0119